MTRYIVAHRRATTVALVVCSVTAVVRIAAESRLTAMDAPTIGPADAVYQGLCDASAAVALSPTTFVVANDEDNRLRVYSTSGNGMPLPGELNLDGFLAAGGGEADIEGAARIGDDVYWITSHGRNKDGKSQPRRLRLFATRVTPNGPTPLTPEGKPFTRLLETFVEPILKAEGFTAAPGGPPDPGKAPEAKGSLNIEGLAAAGSKLLIGFRNPQPEANGSARALVVELENPAALVADPSAAPVRGKVFHLDLGGRGVRSLEALPSGRGFIVAAGPFNDAGTFALYRWDGTDSQPVQIGGDHFTDFTPEALFVSEAPSATNELRVFVLSDDGGRKDEAGTQCKDLPSAKWHTRARMLTLN